MIFVRWGGEGLSRLAPLAPAARLWYSEAAGAGLVARAGHLGEGSWGMQPFVCPQCGHRSAFDPWQGAAHCERCGFTPLSGSAGGSYVGWANRYAYQPYLDELLAHWQGSHPPDRAFTLESAQDAIDFFHDYQRALGEDPRGGTGPYVAYTREYHPHHQEILIFAGAYLRLRRGDRAGAANDLRALTFTSPEFVDAWVWLSATTDDSAERRHSLERATRVDAGHPLARDALALLEGKISAANGRRQERVATAQCPKCGAGLHYEAGAKEVACPHCGHEVELLQINVVDGDATPVHNLRLERHYAGHVWQEAERIVRCRTCGAELTMTGHLARCCAFCGSTNVLVQDGQRKLQQPDGMAPFQIDGELALEAIEKALASVPQRIVSWLGGGRRKLAELQGLYLPFWVFDGVVEKYRIVKDWATSSKKTAGLNTHTNLLFPGVDAPAPELQEAIYPFELQGVVPYEPRLLANWPARLYSLDVELVTESARGALLARTRAQTLEAPTFMQADGQIYYQVLGVTYQLVLLPVWLGLLKGNGRHSLALVNGQSGKVQIGLSPLDDGGQDRGQ